MPRILSQSPAAKRQRDYRAKRRARGIPVPTYVEGIQRFHERLRERGVRAEYKAWDSMKQRCLNPGDRSYDRYGGRGITIDPRWLARDGFETFLRDMGPKPGPHFQIDRIDNDGGYAPDNCRWATVKTNSNNRRSTILVDFEGKRQPLQPLIERFGWKRRQTVWERIKSGWPVLDALTRPAMTRLEIGAESREAATLRRAKQPIGSS
jgi:hypothetical protein